MSSTLQSLGWSHEGRHNTSATTFRLQIILCCPTNRHTQKRVCWMKMMTKTAGLLLLLWMADPSLNCSWQYKPFPRGAAR